MTQTVGLSKFQPFGALTLADLFAMAAVFKPAVDATSLLTNDPQLFVALAAAVAGVALVAARLLVFGIRYYVCSVVAEGPRRKVLLFCSLTALVIALASVQVVVSRSIPLGPNRPTAPSDSTGSSPSPSRAEKWSTAPARTGDTKPLAEAADAVKVALLDLDSRPPARKFDRIDERAAYQAWIAEMAKRLGDRMGDNASRVEFLQTVDYEATRAGLDRQLLLATIDSLSDFKTFSIHPSGSRGLMLVAPHWVHQIGDGDVRRLFSMRVNLRYGCVVLRYYLDHRHGDLFLALNDFADDAYGRLLGTQTAEFPDGVLARWKQRWPYHKPAYKTDTRANSDAVSDSVSATRERRGR